MGNQRALFRIALERHGELRRGTEIADCNVLDLTEKGVQFKTDLALKVGETLQLTFGLTKTRAIECTVMVTRVSPPYVGTCIADISPADQQELSQFIEQLITSNLGGF